MKISALGVLLLAGSTILAACDGNRNYPPPSSATPVASASGKVPTQADIDACNDYAHDQTKTGTGEVVKDAAIGGLGGARSLAGDRGLCRREIHPRLAGNLLTQLVPRVPDRRAPTRGRVEPSWPLARIPFRRIPH